MLVAPSALLANTTRLAWTYTRVPELTGFRIRIPVAGAATKVSNYDAEARRAQIAEFDLPAGTYTAQIRALGTGGEVSDWVNFPEITLIAPPSVTQVCADHTTATPSAQWTVNLGDITEVRIKIDDIEMIQGGPTSTGAPLPDLSSGAHTIKVEGVRDGVVGASASVAFNNTVSTKVCSEVAAGTGVFVANHTTNTILDPSGDPVALRGFRVPRAITQKTPANIGEDVRAITPANLTTWQGQAGGDVAGNCQALEVWWSSDVGFGCGEPDPKVIGDPATGAGYISAGISELKDRIKILGAKGIYSIISVRVGYWDDWAIGGSANPKGLPNAKGWARHDRVVVDAPVVVDGKTYGRHGERFFNWLNWFVPQIISDPEVAQSIAYWEMWHYYGHKNATSEMNAYLDTFMPKLIAHYRKLDPDRLLGAGLVADGAVQALVNRLRDNKPWIPWHRCSGNAQGDKNLLYVIGGYGILGATRKFVQKPTAGETLYDFLANVKNKEYPNNCVNPTYRSEYGKLNIEVLQDLMQAKGWGCAMHQQEGPGLINWWRRNPIPEPASQFFNGLLNDYNRLTNGFAIHSWPPLWTSYVAAADEGWETAKPDTSAKQLGYGPYNESDAKARLQTAMRGDVLT